MVFEDVVWTSLLSEIIKSCWLANLKHRWLKNYALASYVKLNKISEFEIVMQQTIKAKKLGFFQLNWIFIFIYLFVFCLLFSLALIINLILFCEIKYVLINLYILPIINISKSYTSFMLTNQYLFRFLIKKNAVFPQTNLSFILILYIL